VLAGAWSWGLWVECLAHWHQFGGDELAAVAARALWNRWFGSGACQQCEDGSGGVGDVCSLLLEAGA